MPVNNGVIVHLHCIIPPLSIKYSIYDIHTLDIFFWQITTFIKNCVAFVFGLQPLWLIEFTKIKGSEAQPKTKAKKKLLWMLQFDKKSISNVLIWRIGVLCCGRVRGNRAYPIVSCCVKSTSLAFKVAITVVHKLTPFYKTYVGKSPLISKLICNFLWPVTCIQKPK